MTNELVGMSELLLGFGGLILLLILSYLFWQFVRMFRNMADSDERYDIIEQCIIDGYAKKKGINMDKERIKRQVLNVNKKNIRSRLRQEIFDSFFPKKEEK